MLDLALAKRSKNVEFNLAIGEPVLLQELLLGQDIVPKLTQEDLQYPSLGGHPVLLRELQAMYPGKKMVVANGAKQALDAAISYYSQWRAVVTTDGPCWPSFRTIANRCGMGFFNTPEHEANEADRIHIVTAPGNPIGSSPYATKTDIWDAAYASPAYGWNEKDAPFKWEVKVESAAKLFGLSGLRVGWLVTENQAIADFAADFVELSTSGVSNPAQVAVAEMVQRLQRGDLDVAFHSVNLGIKKNYASLYAVLRHYAEETTYDGLGMFEFFKIRPEHQERFEWALQVSDVLMLPGEVFLAHEPGWWRVSLGNNTDVTARAAQALGEALA